MTVKEEHEYAGFRYRMMKEHGIIVAAPHSGQHPAAGKSKQIRAAVKSYLQEHPL